jgi:hypothetical protein
MVRGAQPYTGMTMYAPAMELLHANATHVQVVLAHSAAFMMACMLHSVQ